MMPGEQLEQDFSGFKFRNIHLQVFLNVRLKNVDTQLSLIESKERGQRDILSKSELSIPSAVATDSLTIHG